MSKTSRSRLGVLATFFGVGTFLMVGWVVFQMIVPAEFGKFEKLKLDTNHVKAGSLVFYEAHDCEPPEYSADVFRTISTNTIPPSVTLPVGARFDDRLLCRNVILIPSEAPTGEYRLTITVEYHINPFQNRSKTYVSDVFYITNDKEEFNILEDAVRNEEERNEGNPATPPTPTTLQSIPLETRPSNQAPPRQTTSAPPPEDPSPPQSILPLVEAPLVCISGVCL